MTTAALAQDLRFGLRQFSRRRGAALLAALILALGIGANSAIFSVVDRVLLQPLPYRDPGRLLMLRENVPGISDMLPFTAYEYVRLSDRSRTLAGLALADRVDFTLLDGDEPESVAGARVSANFFALLGVEPIWGRTFRPGDDRPGGEALAVVGNSFYRRHFGADPRLAGKTVRMTSASAFGSAGASPARFIIVGVLPPGFRSPFEDEEIWTPLPLERGSAERKTHALFVLGRLAPGTPLATAQVELGNILRQVEPGLELHQTAGRGATVVPLPELLVRNVRAGILILFAAVGVVLLVVCVNVANLQLAQAVERRREIALRASLGAGRWRLVRQLLSESLLLAVAGGAAGIAIAYGLIRLLLAANPGNIPRLEEIGIDPRMLGFSLLISLATGLLVGVAPAWRGSRADLLESLRPGARAGAGRTHARLRGALVIAEVTLTMVMVVGAGLLAKSLHHLDAQDYGFRGEHVLAVSMTLPGARYPKPAQQAAFFQQVLERVRALPGVRTAGLVSSVPLSRFNSATPFTVEGRPAIAGHSPKAGYRLVSDGYFEAMKIPVLAGRAPAAADLAVEPPPRVALLDRTAARRFFPGEDPIGRRIRMPGADQPTTIIGVVGDVVQRKLTTEAQPTLYLPLINSPHMSIAIAAAGDPLQLAGPAAAAIHALDRQQPIDVATLGQLLSDATARPRFNAIMLGLLALISLLLALVGIYGVMSYTVSQRTHEIGVRMALGARPGALLGQVLARGLALAVTGVAVGSAAAVALTRLLASQLYGVSATDGATFAATALLLLAVAGLAAYAPARRATRVDPTISLREG